MAEDHLGAISAGSSASVSFVAQLGRSFVPALVRLQQDWTAMVAGPEAAAGAAGAAAAAAAAGGLGDAEKQAMLLETLQELAGGYIEMCRRQLDSDEELCDPTQLLQGIRSLLASLAPLHEIAPQAKLLQRASRLCEQLAKRAVDGQMAKLQAGLVGIVRGLGPAATAAGPEALHAVLQTASAAVGGAVRETLSASTPLLAPLASLLQIAPDAMANHLVIRLQAALHAIASAALQPCPDATSALLRAGLCSQLAAEGVAHVQALLKLKLSPEGLGGAALGFETAPTQRLMAAAADHALQTFVELQAQAISHEMRVSVRDANWLTNPAPREVDPFVDQLLARLRSLQSVAAQVFPGEAPRTMLPQGPFPATSAAAWGGAGSRGGGSSEIQKGMQRLFARQISLELKLGVGDKLVLSRMLTQVVKLALKSLVETVRLGTYGRHGAQQLQVDCGMLRWVLPACVDDDGAVLALLDEVLVSCQDRSLEPAGAVDPAVMEGLCEHKRQQLLLALA